MLQKMYYFGTVMMLFPTVDNARDTAFFEYTVQE